MPNNKKADAGRAGGLERQAKARERREAQQFEVHISETGDGPANMLITEGVEYYYIDGVDMNEFRLPKDRQSLTMIQELIDKLMERE